MSAREFLHLAYEEIFAHCCLSVKVIPQKLKFPINFFETFLESSLLSTVSKKKTKMTGHQSRLRAMMGQSYPIYACARTSHAHYSSVHRCYILR